MAILDFQTFPQTMGLAAPEGPPEIVWTPSIWPLAGRLAAPRPGTTTAWATARPSQPWPRTEFCAVYGQIFWVAIGRLHVTVWDLHWSNL